MRYALAIVVLPAAVLAACGSETRVPAANHPPTVLLTGGPVEGSESSYAVRMEWSGHDPDGAIARFEYAIDPPAAFSEEEIASGGEGITSIVVPADGGAPAVTRVSKTVDGEVVSFDWVHTDQFSLRLKFSTTTPDSALESGVLKPQPRYSGVHAFYVRAVDDHEAVSVADHVGFTATTITPEAWITSPPNPVMIASVGTRMTLAWSGVDPDRYPAAGLPVAFEYKLADLHALDPPLSVLKVVGSPDLVLEDDRIPWVRVSAETTSMSVDLGIGGSYLFAVRGVDEAGAKGPFFSFSLPPETGNLLGIISTTAGGIPIVTVQEPHLGTIQGPTVAIPEYQTLAGVPLEFTWSADASAYGGQIEAFNFGIDLETTGDGDPGWQGWTTSAGPAGPVVLDAPGIHYLYFKARDTSGVAAIAVARLVVIARDFTRPMLVVDDFRDTTYPRDTEHDAFWNRIVTGSGRFDSAYLADSTLWQYNVHGLNDVYYREPNSPSLERLGRYRLLVWDCDGAGYDGLSGLLDTGPRTRHLASYLAAGGQIWLSGRATVAAMSVSDNGRADFAFPKEIPSGSFPWEFMKLYSSDMANDKSADNAKNGMLAVEPTATSPFPDMVVDQQKLTPTLRGKYGIGLVDVAMDGIDPARDPGFRGVLEPLYVLRARYPYLELGGSAYDGKVTGIRWHDPDPDRAQGRIMWFGFPVYWFQEDQFQETFNRAIDWFREESPAGR